MHKHFPQKEWNGHECFVFEITPNPVAPIVYEKVFYWVSKEHYLPFGFRINYGNISRIQFS
ncbi:MAG: hypothetical protein ACLFNU_02250 [Bacteroidales bacterium]